MLSTPLPAPTPAPTPAQDESDEEKVLRGVVRIEHVNCPEDYIPAVLARVKPRYLERTYKIFKYENHIDFLEQMAKKSGRLLKGGEPDVNAVSKMVLNDWQRGKLPYFVPPIGCMKMPTEPQVEAEETEEAAEDEAAEAEEVEDEGEEVDDADDSDAETDKPEAMVDPLHEDVRFAMEEKEDREREKAEKAQEKKESKPKVDLRELVKQDLRKITTSVDFFDEEKYEGGKKLPRNMPSKKNKEAEEKVEDKVEEEPEAKLGSSSEKKSKRSSKDEPDDDTGKKKVKTGSGTFNVSPSS